MLFILLFLFELYLSIFFLCLFLILSIVLRFTHFFLRCVLPSSCVASYLLRCLLPSCSCCVASCVASCPRLISCAVSPISLRAVAFRCASRLSFFVCAFCLSIVFRLRVSFLFFFSHYRSFSVSFSYLQSFASLFCLSGEKEIYFDNNVHGNDGNMFLRHVLYSEFQALQNGIR